MLTFLSLAALVLVFSLIVIVSESSYQAHASHNPNLFVSAENLIFGNYFAGAIVVEVIVNEPNLIDTDEEKGEPDVTINGKQLRMAQASDGKWYAYFANVEKAKIADQIVLNAGVEGQSLDFGVFCSSDTDSSVLGTSFSETDGIAIPRAGGITGATNGKSPFTQCTGLPTASEILNNVLKRTRSLNTNSQVQTGQIGINQNAWPIIQLYSFNDVVIQYNGAGGTQSVQLEYDEIPSTVLSLDRTTYPKNAEVFVTINDFQLNQDPTTRDSWTFNVNSPEAIFYQAFTEDGNDSANGGPGLINLVPKLSDLGFEDNGKLSLSVGSVAELVTNNHQPKSSVSDGTTTYSQIITFVESEPNSGIFGNFDFGDQSTIKILGDAPRGQSAEIIYNSKSNSIVSGTPLVYTEEPPDYFDPFAPIYTDKEVYSWTDKVHITIVAPSWNANKYGIDSIGTQGGHFIKISTSKHSLKPYKLTETEPNSGVFVGEVTLTGFLHDVDDDGKIDTNPRTVGTGPTNGFLETERDGGLTISFEFADGVVLTHSVMISWNIGEIIFAEPVYLVGETAKIRVIDPDMNLNPETMDRILVEVSSDSDVAGILVDAIESEDDSGLFEALISFTQNSVSSGNRLFAIPGDSIYAKYEDNTLPSPYSIQDELGIQAKSKIESDVPSLQRISIEDVFVADSFGKPIFEPIVNEPIHIASMISNNQNYDQAFVFIIQVKDQEGIVVSLSWVQGQLTSNQRLDLSQSWIPTELGNYTIESFVWNSLQVPIALSENSSISLLIQ